MPRTYLDHLLALAGQPSSTPGEVEFQGADPVFPHPRRLGEFGAAAIGAVALQAARIHQSRSGVAQHVLMPVDAAAAATRSTRYYRLEDIPGQTPPPVNWNKRGKVDQASFKTRDDRYFAFQREFAYHRAWQEQVLDCEDDHESMAAAVARWDSFELEEAIAAAGACGGVVRSMDEWRAHPQGRAVGSLPPIEIIKLGETAPIPFPSTGDRPLSGVRVMDLTRVLAGPTAGKAFAEHGADVLRVSSSTLPDDATQAIDTGHGKRGADVNIRTVEGLAALFDLLDGADVFLQAFRPGSLEARGLGPVDVSQRRPGIIYATLSAYSHRGPWANRRGFDSVVQNLSGIALENADPATGRPRAVPNPLDYGTGYLLAFGVLAALSRRAVEGGSYLVRVSLAQTGWWLQSLPHFQRSEYESRLAELAPDRVAELTVTEPTPFGMVTHLLPVPQMSATPARWDLPSSPLGSSEPVWRPR